MMLTRTDVERAYKSHRAVDGIRRDDGFGLLYLEKTFGLSADQAEKQVAFGGNAYGIDGYHFDPKRRNFYLFQFKWSDDYGAFKDSLRALCRFGVDFLFGSSYSGPTDQFLLRTKSLIAENRSVIDQVLIHFIFNGDPANADQSEALAIQFEELEGKKYLIDEFFGRRPVSFMFEFRSNSSEAVGGLTHSVKTHKYKIDFSRSIATETPAGEKLQVGFMKLTDLYDMYQEMGARFFDRNVRSGLSAEKPTNKAIRKSFESIVLNESGNPESFIFNHNGVTLAAEHFEVKQGAGYITEPRLLNGAQTVTTLARFIEDNERNPKFEEHLHVLDRVRVLGKIVSSAEQEFVSTVTICNNRQNPVEPWNLRANDPIQLEYQEKFRRDLSMYYERQEGAFATLSDDDLDELGMESTKAIEIRRLAQAILAMQGEIDKLSRLRYVFENDSTYKNTFRDTYLKARSERIVLAYKIQFRSNMVVRDFMERYPNKYHYMGRAKSLVWALLVQAFYNDENADALIERFGSTLSIEVDFADMLKDLASKRVRFIISDLVAEPRFAEMIELGNFSFFRTKATYQRCMQIGGERFGWKKQSF